MRTTIDRAGRIVVPKALRQAAGLKPGTELDVRVVDGRVEIQPAPLDVKLERRGTLLVASPSSRQKPLRHEEVEGVTESLRGGRGRSGS